MWQPFFTPDLLHKYEIEIPDLPSGGGRGGLRCPLTSLVAGLNSVCKGIQLVSH